MKVRNRVKTLLNEAGLESVRPTEKLLSDTLGGMSLIRFNQIWDNSSKTELSIYEVRCLETWLNKLFGHEVEVLEPSTTAVAHG